MKTSKNFHKSKKSKPFDGDGEARLKKVGSPSKKKKYFKREIQEEIDETEEFDLFAFKDESIEDE